ncbi:hypothetical protein B0A48_15471 [Cryoendolithus antarcticus]|uniref:Phytocyanin domain-containing protein n=1 Tax=Cryoendolithus antarcticus TaxID=1507870 RepID=A0A1V8SGD2_9PEZI|nr:hypothetical protein B0A48_15471 [Cryoendolithus antarcticus]
MPSMRWPWTPLLALLSYTLRTSAQITTDPDIFIDNSTAITYAQGEVTVHQVTVGNNSYSFSPNSITATPGDIISFTFWPGGHSVIHSQFGYPCIPWEDLHDGSGAFYSGVSNATADYRPTWNLTVNDTRPLFFYCGAPGSCVGHAMLGAINPVAETPLLTQMALAKEADYSLLPGQALPDSALSSLSALAQTATTVTVTASHTSAAATTAAAATTTTAATAAVSSSHSALSAGAIAGIAIAGVVVLALAAGLFYFFGRSKTLKEQVQQAREDGHNQSRHASMMPPSYAPSWGGHRESGYKPTNEVEGSVVGTPGGPNRMGSPEMRESGFVGRGPYRFSNMSEPDPGAGHPFSSPHQPLPQELETRIGRSPT